MGQTERSDRLDARRERAGVELTMQELQKRQTNDGNTHIVGAIFQCSKCHRPFAERSRHCPYCDSKTMGELRPIKESERAALREREIRRLKRKYA